MRLRIIYLLLFLGPIFFQLSCGETNTGIKPKNTKGFITAFLELDFSYKNALFLILTNDGTIKRAGIGVVDPTNYDLLTGTTDDKIFQSLMETISDSLLSYCGHNHDYCNTSDPSIKAVIFFSYGNHTSTSFVYCINGTYDQLPKPIRDYIANAIRLTDPWYYQQKNMLKVK